MELFSFMAPALVALALALVSGRALLALLPPGVPGGGSRAELPGVLAASLLLGALLFRTVDALGGGAAALALAAGLPVAAVAVRTWLGPAAMRPRRPLRPRPPGGPLERAAGLGLAIAGAVLVGWRTSDVSHTGWPIADAEGATTVRDIDLEALVWLAVLTGWVSLWGLAQGLGVLARRGAVLAALLGVLLLAPPVGELLAPILADPERPPVRHPAVLAEGPLVALIAAAALLAVFRRRAERRCLVLAPLALVAPAAMHPAGHRPPAWPLALALVLAFAFVPAASRRRAAGPFVLALALALVHGR